MTDQRTVSFNDIEGAGITLAFTEIAAIYVKWQGASVIYRCGQSDGWRVTYQTAQRIEQDWEMWRQRHPEKAR